MKSEKDQIKDLEKDVRHLKAYKDYWQTKNYANTAAKDIISKLLEGIALIAAANSEITELAAYLEDEAELSLPAYEDD